METLTSCQFCHILGLDTIGTRSTVCQILACCHILQRIVAGSRVESNVPCHTVVGCSIPITHRYPLQVTTFINTQELRTQTISLIFEIILLLVVLFKDIGRSSKLTSCWCQSIFTQSLSQKRVSDIKNLSTRILMCSIHTVWPHVGAIAIQAVGRTIVQEAQGTGSTHTQPITAGRIGTEERILPGYVGSHTDGMQHLME